MNTRQQFHEVFLVTNANKFKYYERWATANDFPVANIVNDGTTTYDARSSTASLEPTLHHTCGAASREEPSSTSVPIP